MYSKDRYSGAYTEVDVVNKTIDKANSVDFFGILKLYSLQADSNNWLSCPLYAHIKDKGAERTPSFLVYPDTNSFFCWGCKIGGGPVEFVSCRENISRYKAASHILSNFTPNNSEVSHERTNNYRVYLEFSHLIRGFILEHKGESSALAHAEKMCSAFDNIRSKYNLDPEGFDMMFTNLKKKLEIFA